MKEREVTMTYGLVGKGLPRLPPKMAAFFFFRHQQSARPIQQSITAELKHHRNHTTKQTEVNTMAFFNSAVDVLQTLVIALGAGLGIWGVINLLEGYGQDNPASKGQYS
jgi:hypothetical protein